MKRARGRRSDREFVETLLAVITPAERSRWSAGTVADWANEAHVIAERIAYGELPNGSAPVIDARYERDAEQAIALHSSAPACA